MCKYLLLLLCLPCIAVAQRASGYYSDYLQDANGQPLAGASVVIKGSQSGVSTDKNGYFRIYVSEGNIIQISSVGYVTSERKITAAMLRTHAGTTLKVIESILSDDYKKLIYQQQITEDNLPDSSLVTPPKILQLAGGYNYNLPIKDIEVRNNRLQIYNTVRKQLAISGRYSATVEINNANRTPALQTQYVQGRPVNGVITWRGAETGELFSFGPSVSTLAFDGNAYKYDINGRLEPAGRFSSNSINAYNNSIFQTGFLQSQSFNLQSSLITNNKRVANFNISLGQTDQSTIIRQNKNSNNFLTASAGIVKEQFSISGTYSYVQRKIKNGNRNAFLNRVYQNALLTPISFDNSQGYQFENGQRSYSSQADNPYFLLNDNGNSYCRQQHNAGLIFEKKHKEWNYKLMQAFEATRQISKEGYKPGTVYFENGFHTKRVQADNNYSLHANAIRKITFNNYYFNAEVSANYHLDAANTSIRYSLPNINYRYQRLSHNASINSKGGYRNGNFETGYEVSNKMYISNTSSQSNWLLPSTGVYVRFSNVLDAIGVKLSSAYNSFNSELPINQSLAHTALLQYSTQQSAQYFPLQEVSGYKRLVPVNRKEWNSRIELSYGYKASLSAEVFTKNVSNDIFPVLQNGVYLLKNIAGHKIKGIELQLNINDSYGYRKKVTSHHSLSFLAYHSRVTSVENGFNYLPIAGFSNVHKAVVKGQPLGVIMGNSFSKDANNNVIIGDDGFPLVNNQVQVIGNPIPDFIMKLNNNLQWKKLSLHIDWEWKKGGDIWNGTQATLDYYGRSENTGRLRNTTGYIFPGVMQNGQKNNTPVSFLNVNEPLENNRWTRYGYSGIAEAYIEKADYLKINTATIAYKFNLKKYIQAVTLSAYINNILLWSAYSGADPNQLFYDQPNGEGLDFFNIPSAKTIGFSASIQF
jgi:hypothetical protein